MNQKDIYFGQKDISDYYHIITKTTTKEEPDSLISKSLGPFVTPLIYPGYALVTGFIAGLAANVSFYTYRSDSAKISSILFSNVYSQYNQLFSFINSDIWTYHEKYNFIGEWGYYKFPTNTYGLGSQSSFADVTPVDYKQVRVYEVALRKITSNFGLGIGYNLDYHWKINADTLPGFEDEDLNDYPLSSTSTSSGFTLNMQYDNRLNSNNPINGNYLNVQYRDNVTWLGSTNSWQSLLIDARHYFKLSPKSDNVLALWTYDWLTLKGLPPYFDLPTIGGDQYNSTGRSYALGRYRGLNLLYAEAEYRFRITKDDFVGGVLFSNVAAFSNYPDNKFNGVNPGIGTGLRIKMNKKSGTNLCIDYSIGADGSKGFAFNLNEVF